MRYVLSCTVTQWRRAAVVTLLLLAYLAAPGAAADSSSAIPPAKQKPKTNAQAAAQGLAIAKDVNKLKFKAVEITGYGMLGTTDSIAGKRTLIRDAGKVGTAGKVVSRVLGAAEAGVKCTDGTEACGDALVDLATSEAKSQAIKLVAQRAFGAVAGSAVAAGWACGEVIGGVTNYVLEECTGKSGPDWSADILGEAWGKLQYGDPDEITSPEAIKRHGDRMRLQRALEAGEPWALEKQREFQEEIAAQAREVERNVRNPLTLLEKPFERARKMLELPALPPGEVQKQDDGLHDLFDEPEEPSEPTRKTGTSLDLSGGMELGRERRQGAATKSMSNAHGRTPANAASTPAAPQAVSPVTIPLLDCRTLGTDREVVQYCDQLMNNLERDLVKPGVRFERRGLDYFAKPPDALR